MCISIIYVSGIVREVELSEEFKNSATQKTRVQQDTGIAS